MENGQNYIGYIRRSKKTQDSSLGLQAQKTEILRHTAMGNLIHTYIELETGTSSGRNKRVEIYKAIEHAKRANAILVIAKLDRLARDVEFTAKLMNQGIRFIACDIPGANEFTIHVMAAIAEQEAKRISERTKAALARRIGPKGWQAHKTRSGCPFTQEGRIKGGMVMKEQAQANPNNKRARNYCISLYEKGYSLERIAKKLNKEGFQSPMGKQVNKITVRRWITN